MQPIYWHDGNGCCDYLGPYGEDESKPIDLWVCTFGDKTPELIARYSDYAADYGCVNTETLKVMPRCEPTEQYYVALERAERMGFV